MTYQPQEFNSDVVGSSIKMVLGGVLGGLLLWGGMAAWIHYIPRVCDPACPEVPAGTYRG